MSRILPITLYLFPSLVKPFGYLILLGLGTVSVAGLGAMDLQTLVDRSPFSPPKSAVAESGTQDQPGTLEFRGMVVDAAGTSYSVFDVTASRGYWLKEGGDGAIRVKSYSAQDNQLEVEQNGKPVKLQLKRATIQAGAPMVAAPAPRPPSQPGMPQPGGGPGVGRPTGEPGADARRLEAVAAEVRRRRALRNAAANPAAAPQPAAGQPAAAPPPAQ